jgi:hypothetical protein
LENNGIEDCDLFKKQTRTISWFGLLPRGRMIIKKTQSHCEASVQMQVRQSTEEALKTAIRSQNISRSTTEREKKKINH